MSNAASVQRHEAEVHAALPDLPLEPAVAIIDLETTGLDPRIDRVIEIAIFVPESPPLCTLVNPGLDVFPAGVHGISPAAVRGAPRFAEITERLRALLAGRVLVAHNALFDLSFLSEEFRRIGPPWSLPRHICTISMAESLGLDHESRGLAYACVRHRIAHAAPHQAASDALAAAGLLARYTEIAIAQGKDLASFVEASPPA